MNQNLHKTQINVFACVHKYDDINLDMDVGIDINTHIKILYAYRQRKIQICDRYIHI